MEQNSGRRSLIAGNWKLYKTAGEAVEYILKIKELLSGDPGVDVVLAPAFPALDAAVKAAAGSKIEIAAQNVYWEEEGAFTGEVSVGMLKDVGVHTAIIGHSERRQYFGETDDTVNRRVKASLAGVVKPIVCIGENLEEREAGQTMSVLESQVSGGLAGLSEQDGEKLVMAYEPVWAIGTGKTATPEIAQEAHRFIRDMLENLFNKTLANKIRILYGGSVKPDNVAALMAKPDIDGALVGGASLKPDVFIKIIQF